MSSAEQIMKYNQTFISNTVDENIQTFTVSVTRFCTLLSNTQLIIIPILIEGQEAQI